ncbi:DUF2207 domain-containing protein [Bacillus paranthracis]|uniref:DUF2207 domain-containing protein n=1 Tax=Bacillus paranthracis TaxID=2026186 RepID=UPI00148F0F4D|nr:DUF2207 domain-containing protein [Bacillus paranthracis]NOP79593.1 DUF2207 domain-containing protein [Bacillus paranthracis]
MDKSIKGITIQLGADTSKLGNALKDVTEKSTKLTQELKQVEKGLKFSPGNAELLAQKQQLLSEQVGNTTEKLNRLKAAQEQVNQKFSQGKISAEQYRAFNREVVATENHLNSLKGRLAATESEQENIAKSTRQLETLFRATGTSIDNFASALGSKLTNAIKNGTASAKQLDEAISRIGTEALGTNADVERMRRALSSIDSGNSLRNVERDLRGISREAQRASREVREMDVGLENIAGGLVAGAGAQSVIEKAMDVSMLKTKIDVSFNVPPEAKKSIEEAIRGIEAYGVDGEAALEGVRRQWALNKNVSNEANAEIVKSAAVISNSYAGIDFTELIQETNEIASELGISQEGAMGLTDALLKVGFPPEQLDIIAEYGQQLTRAGYNAEEVQAIMEAGVETGTWNIDNLLDGLKEGRIKAAEFGQGVDKAMTEAIEGTSISAEQLGKWGKSVAKGGKEGSAAMTEIAKALVKIEDETKRNEIGVKLFGTMYEDQGQNITNTLIEASNKTIDFKKNQDNLNESIKKMDDNPAIKFKKAMADLTTALEPALSVVADVIGAFASWVSKNPELAATLAAIATVIGIISGAILALAPIVVTLTQLFGLGALAASGVALIIPIVIAAIVAMAYAIYKNWDAISKKAKEIWEGISKFFSDLWKGIKRDASKKWAEFTKEVSKIWGGIAKLASKIWGKIAKTTMGVWKDISSFFKKTWGGITSFFESSLKKLTKLFEKGWTNVSKTFKSIWKGIESFIKPLVKGIVDFYVSNYTKLLNTTKKIFSGISKVIKEIWGFIAQYLKGLWTALLYFVTPIFESIKSAIVNTWNKVKETTNLIWNGIKTYLLELWNSIVGFVVPIYEKIKNTIVGAWTWIEEKSVEIWTAIKTYLLELWNSIVEFVVPIYDSIKNTIVNAWTWVKDKSVEIWNGITEFLSKVWNGIVKFAVPIYEAIKNTIVDAWNWISTKSSEIWNGVTSTLSDIWTGIKSTASDLWEGLKNVIMTPVNAIVDAVPKAFESMKKGALDAWEGLKSGIKTIINGIISLINKFIDGFNTPADVLNKIPDVDMPKIPHVPMLATGGNVTGDGQFIVGERGAELVTKMGSSVKVTPLSNTEKSLGITGQFSQALSEMGNTLYSALGRMAGTPTMGVPNQSKMIQGMSQQSMGDKQPVQLVIDGFVLGEVLLPVIDGMQVSKMQTELYVNGVRR